MTAGRRLPALIKAEAGADQARDRRVRRASRSAGRERPDQRRAGLSQDRPVVRGLVRFVRIHPLRHGCQVSRARYEHTRCDPPRIPLTSEMDHPMHQLISLASSFAIICVGLILAGSPRTTQPRKETGRTSPSAAGRPPAPAAVQPIAVRPICRRSDSSYSRTTFFGAVRRNASSDELAGLIDVDEVQPHPDPAEPARGVPLLVDLRPAVDHRVPLFERRLHEEVAAVGRDVADAASAEGEDRRSVAVLPLTRVGQRGGQVQEVRRRPRPWSASCRKPPTGLCPAVRVSGVRSGGPAGPAG